jgi:SRSO17 transposase
MATSSTGTQRLPKLDEWAADFESFHERFADLFARKEPRERSRSSIRALLGGTERRNGWQIAEAVGEKQPRGTERLLSEAHWSASEARARLQAFLIEELGAPDGIAVLDETGFLKKGTHSVGVARQYTGTAGKVENCQVGVFLGYSSPRGHALVDAELYLPRVWTEDRARCQAAKVPDDVEFATKPALGQRMLQRAAENGLPFSWVTGDEVYGNDPKLRAWLSREHCSFVLAVAGSTHVWSRPPRVQHPRRRRGLGRPRTRPRITPQPLRISTWVKTWPEKDFKTLVVHEGEKGPNAYDWAARRIIEKNKQRPGPERWLLVRKSQDDSPEYAYYLSNASLDTPLATLAQVAASRYVIEQCLEEAKDDVGMDQYEVRNWDAWYRFITLSLMAAGWLASVRRRLAEREPSTPSRSSTTSRNGKKGDIPSASPLGLSPRPDACC